MPVKAIYPGTFDPPTNGHVDLIQRGSKLFDHLTVAILMNPVKNPLFTVAERMEMLKEATKPLGNVSVAKFDGLMVEFALTSLTCTLIPRVPTHSSKCPTTPAWP